MARRVDPQVAGILAAGEDSLGDAGAVFGLSFASAPPPAWLEDDSEVGRRICAKTKDTVGADVWWRVAEVTRICRRLGYVPGDATRERELRTVRRALATSLSTADLLPWPLPVACAAVEPLPESASAFGALGARRDRIDRAAHRLADALDEPDWVDPDALAGWVDDAVLALRAYGLRLLATGT